MTASEILAKIQKDPVFAIGFALDNNPAAVIDAMNASGLPVMNVNDARQKLMGLINGAPQILQSVFDKVPYLNVDPVTNYTGGFLNYFASNTKPEKLAVVAANTSGKFDLGALLSGLGAGLSTFANYGGGSSGGGTTPPTDPSVLLLQQQQAAQAAVDAAAKKKRNLIIGFSIVGGIIVIVVLYFVFRPKKNKPPESE